MKEYCLLAAPPGLLSLLSYRTIYSGVTPPNSVLSPSPSIINQENALETCLQASLLESLSQLRFVLPKITLACVELTEM